jgi:hypothetical protein
MRLAGKITYISLCFYLFTSHLSYSQKNKISSANVATLWANMTTQVMTAAPKNSPTYGSRALGYLGLTMYETVVWSDPRYRSIATSLCDTLSMPKPIAQKKYCWELALNAGQAFLLKQLYGYTEKTSPVDSLEKVIHTQYAAKKSTNVVQMSEDFGRAIAETIYNWSKSDGGHEGYTRNFPPNYISLIGTGLWVPPIVGQSPSRIPLHPNWGKNRPFIRQNGLLPNPEPMAYSEESTSRYYKDYKEVYDRNKTLTAADHEIIFWWGDDPSETCSPPGHSYNLATIAIKKRNASLLLAAQTYCRVGMAVADAFIMCWRTKYAYNVERPSSFIRNHLDTSKSDIYNRWFPAFPEPPFSAFYSGHATQSAATATVLTDIYGDNFSFVDDTHIGRKGGYAYKNRYYYLTFKPRQFASFWESAKECAESRLLGGIHTRHDNETGLSEGTKIGRNVNAIQWTNRPAHSPKQASPRKYKTTNRIMALH